jgi:hypothetical protein
MIPLRVRENVGLAVAWAFATGLLASHPNAANAPSDLSPAFAALLTGDLKFSQNDFAELARGKIVKHGLSSTTPGEVAAVGAVRIASTRQRFVDSYRDIARFKQAPDVLQIGRFSNPPEAGDLGPLTIDKDDADLQGCRVGDCDVRLPADAIMRLQREIDWTARDASERAAQLFKAVLFESVRGYVSGQRRITEYDDEKKPIRPLEDFAGVLKNSPYIGRLVPELPRYLEAFPALPLPAAEDFLYWSKEKFGFAPFISVTHVTLTRDTAGNDVLTSKDVYSSRYFDASLTMTVASDVVDRPDSFYLVYVNRSRANALKGLFAGLRRSIVERRAKGTLEEGLKRIKDRLEARPQSPSAP